MKRLTVTLPLALLGAVILTADEALAFGGYGWCGPGMGFGVGGGPMGWFGVLLMFAFWALVIGALVALLRGAFRYARGEGTKGGGSDQDDRALALLRERFARGDIDEAEFTARRQALGG